MINEKLRDKKEMYFKCNDINYDLIKYEEEGSIKKYLKYSIINLSNLNNKIVRKEVSCI
jgi:hypothetical protein